MHESYGARFGRYAGYAVTALAGAAVTTTASAATFGLAGFVLAGTQGLIYGTRVLPGLTLLVAVAAAVGGGER